MATETDGDWTYHITGVRGCGCAARTQAQASESTETGRAVAGFGFGAGHRHATLADPHLIRWTLEIRQDQAFRDQTRSRELRREIGRARGGRGWRAYSPPLREIKLDR